MIHESCEVDANAFRGNAIKELQLNIENAFLLV